MSRGDDTGGDLQYTDFGEGDPLARLGRSKQATYLRKYLADLGCVSVVMEPFYFDRDYLSEHESFFASSARRYPNTCRRLHFFSELVDGPRLRRAVSGQGDEGLQDCYLGFVVLRPQVAAPFGRTVLKWYPQSGEHKRVAVQRRYTCHLAGLELHVHGLAWQQQDGAVSACASVAIWSLLHSSALDEWHWVPTTAQIAAAAFPPGVGGERVFPSAGLNIGQIAQVIGTIGLVPMLMEGLHPNGDGDLPEFTRRRFTALLGLLLNSGFPVLAFCRTEPGDQPPDGTRLSVRESNLHAICIVGSKWSKAVGAPEGPIPADIRIGFVYLHDDNLGPSVRFQLQGELDDAVALIPARPTSVPAPANGSDPAAIYEQISPQYLVAAVPHDLRLAPDSLERLGGDVAEELAKILGEDDPDAERELVYSPRYINLVDFVGDMFSRLLGHTPRALAEARLALWQRVQPMSRVVGLVQVELRGTILVHVLFDTTDPSCPRPAFCTVSYSPTLTELLQEDERDGLWEFGQVIPGHA